MRDLLLIDLFFSRFVEHESIARSSHRRSALVAGVGGLLAGGLIAAFIVAVPYQLFAALPAGMTALRSLDDRFLFMSLSMYIMALAAVAGWDALALDAMDAAVLGTLPVSTSMLVRSKCAATGVFALSVLCAWNVGPTLLRATAVPEGLHLGWSSMLRLTLAHGVASGAAGVFGFFAVFTLRESTCALFGDVRFARVSVALQTGLLLLLVSAILVLPARASNVGLRWLADDRQIAMAEPAVWFVGLHERLAGSAFDTSTRTRPIRRALLKREVDATATYRSLRPTLLKLGRRALVGLSGVATIAMVASLWNRRRLPTGAAARSGRPGSVSRAWLRLASRVIVRTEQQQAGFFFALQCLMRRTETRGIMAASMGLSMSILFVASGDVNPTPGPLDPPSVVFLSAQPLVLCVLLVGFWQSAHGRVDSSGRGTILLAWPREATSFVVGVRRAAWVGVVVPALLTLASWHTLMLPSRSAFLHCALGIAVARIVIDVLFFRCERLPFVSAGVPSSNGTATRMLWCGGAVMGSLTMALVERWALGRLWLYLAMLATLMGIIGALRLLGPISVTAALAGDPDEHLPPATQWLNLHD